MLVVIPGVMTKKIILKQTEKEIRKESGYIRKKKKITKESGNTGIDK